MVKKTEKDELQESCKGITDGISSWKQIRDRGCNDPSWADGCNMNLCRNHVIYYKTRIQELCVQAGRQFPPEYYLPTPPEVSNCYMAKASMKQTGRVKRLMLYGEKFETGKIPYDEAQLSFC